MSSEAQRLKFKHKLPVSIFFFLVPVSTGQMLNVYSSSFCLFVFECFRRPQLGAVAVPRVPPHLPPPSVAHIS